MKPTILLLVLFGMLTSCKTTKVDNANPEDFDAFLTKFRTEKAFQKERTRFPLIQHVNEFGGEGIPEVREMSMADWIFDPIATVGGPNGMKEINVVNEKTLHLLTGEEGTDNVTDYFFEKEDGKWFLVRKEWWE